MGKQVRFTVALNVGPEAKSTKMKEETEKRFAEQLASRYLKVNLGV